MFDLGAEMFGNYAFIVVPTSVGLRVTTDRKVGEMDVTKVRTPSGGLNRR